jgi:hypothetical protein
MQWPKNLLSPVLALLTSCASPATIMGVGINDPSALKPALTDTTPTNSASKPPMVSQNPGGTFTVRKEPSKGAAKDGKVDKGLVIPAQVVAPTIPTFGKNSGGRKIAAVN